MEKKIGTIVKKNKRTGKYQEKEVEIGGSSRINLQKSYSDNWDKGLYSTCEEESKTKKKGLEQVGPKSFKYSDDEITELNLSNEKILEGSLEVDCPKLEKLSCSDRILTFLNVRKCPKLKELQCWYNDLTNLDLSNNPDLEIVVCFANKLKLNLDIFSHLTKLKKLDLGVECAGNSDRVNDFFGSLKSLENCKQLEYLCIGYNKRINKGLEYLPTGLLTNFGCHGTFYKDQLKPFDYDILTWRLFKHFDMFSDDFYDEEMKEVRLEALGKKLKESKKELTKVLQNNPGWAKRIERLETKIKLLEKEISPSLEAKVEQLKLE